jgi:CRISPR-associated endonuclease/helicase Cas3
MTATPFDRDFATLTGMLPLPWQAELFQRLAAGDVPTRCDLPTGLGKTSVIVIWLLALAANPKLPRRLAYVVNRRTVVDQATTVCESLVVQLRHPSAQACRERLLALAATSKPEDDPVAISTLRGQRADNAEWRRDPTRPSIVVGTVDMIGSRLLFSGYGCGFRTRPLHAGLLGQDTLLVHDEAHLEPAFQSLLDAIAAEQHRCAERRPLKVMALTATSREAPDFTLGDADHDHPVVAARLHARKGLAFHSLSDPRQTAEAVAQDASSLSGRTLVFLTRVDDVERCADRLRKQHGGQRVAVLTGTMRGAERDELGMHPVFARFMPAPSGDVALQQGDVWLVATAAGEVGIDISADHMLTDLVPFDSMAQRLGRVNRYGQGEATVAVYADVAPPDATDTQNGQGEPEDAAAASQRQYDAARHLTWRLLHKLPMRPDGRREASPAALRALPLKDRRAASTPLPILRHVDGILFDRWAFTTLPDPLPGRPPVADWLHGLAEWEPPRTAVAWRREVAWLDAEQLGAEGLADFLADYPLRNREVLSDRTDRVVKHLDKIAQRQPETKAWLVTAHGAEFMLLAELLEAHDPRKSPLLAGATVVLPPQAGGLAAGLLAGGTEFQPGEELRYDLGPRTGEREVIQGDEAEVLAPAGMRLVRALRRSGTADAVAEPADASAVWCLFAPARVADEVSSMTSRTRQTLANHLGRTRHWAERIAERLGLPEEERRVLALAGLWHDRGKQRAVWQASIRNASAVPLAKGPMRPAELGHYRHELGSLVDMLDMPELADLSAEQRDLAIHLVAAHHGRARPSFPEHEAFDPEQPTAKVSAVVAAVPLRFDRLQRRHGRWGLAWLESLLRAADALASEDEEAEEDSK